MMTQKDIMAAIRPLGLDPKRFDYGRLVADTLGEFSREALAYKKGEDFIWR